MSGLQAARRALTRFARSPFPAGSEPPLLIHCCHHKVGTVWFKRVLTSVGKAYGLRMQDLAQGEHKPHHDVLFDDHSRINLATLSPFRGSHMVRDPRDIVVSAYFYHLRTTEEWALEPKEEYGDKSYQEHLRQFDTEEGLAVEARRCAGTILRDMSAWHYNDPRFLELRYEEHIADEETGFRRLFEHYGFTEEAVGKCVEIALELSLSRVKKTSSHHIRSGQPNDWKNHFTPAVKQAFKDAAGDSVQKLGYEQDSNW